MAAPQGRPWSPAHHSPTQLLLVPPGTWLEKLPTATGPVLEAGQKGQKEPSEFQRAPCLEP